MWAGVVILAAGWAFAIYNTRNERRVMRELELDIAALRELGQDAQADGLAGMLATMKKAGRQFRFILAVTPVVWVLLVWAAVRG